MTLMFDRFRDMESARAFAKMAKQRFGGDVMVFDDAAKAERYHTFFFTSPPIVIVDCHRRLLSPKTARSLAKRYGGSFVG